MKEEIKLKKDNAIIYKILRPILTVIFKLYYNPTIINKEYIPKNGRAVIAGKDLVIFAGACQSFFEAIIASRC